MREIKFKPLILISYVWFTLVPLHAQEQDKLIFAIDVVRHGDRTPLQHVPALSHHWPQGLGQLTAKGIQQTFELGTKLRKKYIQDYHLLPTQYEPKTLYVRSTDYDRTFMSAQSLLQGLYPLRTGPQTTGKPVLPGGFQPIPIHTMRANEEDVLVVDTTSPRMKQLLEKYVFSRADWQAKNHMLQNKYATWSQATGLQISSLSELTLLADTLYVNKLHGVALPKALSRQDIDEIITSGNWCFTAKFKPKEVGQEMGKNLLATILHFLKQAHHQDATLKYVLLVGHDSSILALLSALGAPLEQPPGYASWVNFSLFERKNGEREIEVRFNERLVQVEACHHAACTLGQLASLLNEKQPMTARLPG